VICLSQGERERERERRGEERSTMILDYPRLLIIILLLLLLCELVFK
jgi:hypothetical protein